MKNNTLFSFIQLLHKLKINFFDWLLDISGKKHLKRRIYQFKVFFISLTRWTFNIKWCKQFFACVRTQMRDHLKCFSFVDEQTSGDSTRLCWVNHIRYILSSQNLNFLSKENRIELRKLTEGIKLSHSSVYSLFNSSEYQVFLNWFFFLIRFLSLKNLHTLCVNIND